MSRMVAAYVETQEACWLLAARLPEDAAAGGEVARQPVRLLRAVLVGDRHGAEQLFEKLRPWLESKTILYAPLSRGGDVVHFAQAQSLHRLLSLLLTVLPRLSLVRDAGRLLDTIGGMERRRPSGEGLVTEFDSLFEVATAGLVESLASAAEHESRLRGIPSHDEERNLFGELLNLAEPLVARWVRSSRQLRLSSAESVLDDRQWEPLVDFIRRYGRGLFTQQFMNAGNLRGILRQGVKEYLELIAEDPPEGCLTLVSDWQGSDVRGALERYLELVLEIVVENYPEYRDFNSTTTQSDRGELLYILLDFLRLKASYCRVAWNLRPLILIHETLIRQGYVDVARSWRELIEKRSSATADLHQQRADDLVRTHGLRLPTVMDLVAERFFRPLESDICRAHLRPAFCHPEAGARQAAFEQLAGCVNDLCARPTGAGLDVPAWLAALEDEVDELEAGGDEDAPHARWEPGQISPLSLAQWRSELRDWERNETTDAGR